MKKSSWKTTTLGLIAGATIILGEVRAARDDNPETQPNIEALIGALGVIGLGAAARDNDVSSEEAGVSDDTHNHFNFHFHFPALGDPRAPDTILHFLAEIKERLKIMPTNADLTNEIEGLKTSLTDTLNTELEQLATKLEAGSVSAENVQLVRDFKDAFAARIAAIVPDAPPTDPATPA